MQQGTGLRAISPRDLGTQRPLMLRGIAGPEEVGLEVALERRNREGGWEPTPSGYALIEFIAEYASRPMAQGVLDLMQEAILADEPVFTERAGGAS